MTLPAAIEVSRRSKRIDLLQTGYAIPLAFVHEWISDAIYVFVALMWLVPDRRIESRLA